MLKTFLLILGIITTTLFGGSLWNHFSQGPETETLKIMNREQYKIFVKKALARNINPKSYIISKGKILLNSGYIRDTESYGVNQENITVWNTKEKIQNSGKNPKNISIWVMGDSGTLESNTAEIEAEKKKDTQKGNLKNLNISSVKGRTRSSTKNKLLGLANNFPKNISGIGLTSGDIGNIGSNPLGSKLETESQEAKSSGLSQLRVWGEEVNGGSLYYNDIINISQDIPEDAGKYYETYVNR